MTDLRRFAQLRAMAEMLGGLKEKNGNLNVLLITGCLFMSFVLVHTFDTPYKVMWC